MSSDQAASFADWVVALREERHLTQIELATKMGVASSIISRVESGQREATSDFVVTFAYALGLDVREALVRAGFPVNLVDNRGMEGLVRDAKAGLEVGRLLAAIKDDDERQAALDDIRALLRARAARIKARKTSQPGH